MPEKLLAVAMIVRDEESLLAGCLGSVAAVADEIVIHDTGSVDDSVQTALSLGATVIPGGWRDHFAQARNEALAETHAEWVLSIDADEVAHVDAQALRGLLVAAPAEVDAYAIQITNLTGPDGRGLGSYPEAKLFRRERCLWSGRVHERLQLGEGGSVHVATMPTSVLRLTHSGYSDETVFKAKAQRNTRLCQIELEALLLLGEQQRTGLSRVALDLGRSVMGCGQTESAVAAFMMVRDLPDRGEEWAWATDFLARIALAAGDPHRALELTQELEDNFDAPRYCQWLRAQALAELGQVEECYDLLIGLDSVPDLAGRPLDRGRVLELMALAAEHMNRPGPVLTAVHAQVAASA